MRHDGCHVAVAQAEDATYDVVLDGLYLPRIHAFAHDGFYLLFRYLVLSLAKAQCPGDERRAAGEEPHQRGRQNRERFHGPGHGHRHFFRRGHADSFRDEFSEDECQVGNRDHDDGLGDAEGVGS
jgi:hypothetical protein